MKRKLIILSDLWGTINSVWVNNYVELLKDHFTISYYDCCELGNVSKKNTFKEKLHSEFIDRGIATAVAKLIALEKNKVTILAFSIGGLIAWKYGLRTNNINSLYCISSTRLRLETNKPNAEIIHLYFGENDTYKPDKEWFSKINISYDIIKNQGHEFYTNPHLAEIICNRILKNV